MKPHIADQERIKATAIHIDIGHFPRLHNHPHL
jgi:hypothetical protein